ncbi:hypothetical protein BSIN_0871 [Burkholderia singularis]|uniref:Uncharacterized protein n=1 Tax=Burkholderia singularis TaxID=1503053 RepID=A0A238H9V0_9BURK|nr:hypothetical protein BSIN_0871 [Burkholderia singularis]
MGSWHWVCAGYRAGHARRKPAVIRFARLSKERADPAVRWGAHATSSSAC